MNINKASEEYNTIKYIVEDIFKNLGKDYEILCMKPAVIYSYNQENDTAKVKFLTDLNVVSTSYKNLTKDTLVPNQKVYIVHKFGDTEQGWVMMK